MILGAKIDLLPNHLKFVNQLIHMYDYIEVYFKPNSVVDHNDALATHEKWVVHAPHHNDAINLAFKMESNKAVNESIVFAGKLGAEYVIIHPGFLLNSQLPMTEEHTKNILSNIEEFKEVAKTSNVQLLLENLPFRHTENSVGFGSTPEEMEFFLNKTKCGFVFDLPHACHSSVSHKADYKKFLPKFMELKPKMFHMYDGRATDETDTHLTLGQGNLDIPFFISFIKNNRVTLELNPPTVDTFINAIKFLDRLGSNRQLQ
jgi:sugar phosphate isomerase/epimerase